MLLEKGTHFSSAFFKKWARKKVLIYQQLFNDARLADTLVEGIFAVLVRTIIVIATTPLMVAAISRAKVIPLSPIAVGGRLSEMRDVKVSIARVIVIRRECV